jgi:iron complex outermembrane receptor protein
MNFYFQKENIYGAYHTETITPSYLLFNAGTGFDFLDKKQKTIFTFVLSAQNLTDVAYQNHLSRLKYLSENELTGRQGVFNMGRNFMIKMIIPVNIR